MYHLITLLILLMSMYSCQDEAYNPEEGDLIFRVAETTEYSKAITDATAQNDAVKFDHVGIIILEEGLPQVLEATSKKGVTFTRMENFISDSSSGYVIKRINQSYPLKEAIDRAKSHLGEPYDWSYLPDNGKMYCSELVYESFRTDDGLPLFQARPMNFKDAEGKMPQFWINLFERLGEDIPQGVLGTNPTDLSKETSLKEIYRAIPSDHHK